MYHIPYGRTNFQADFLDNEYIGVYRSIIERKQTPSDASTEGYRQDFSDSQISVVKCCMTYGREGERVPAVSPYY